MGEYVIKILSRPKGRGDNGPRKRFGRPKNPPRRLALGVTPPFVSSTEVLTQVAGVDDFAILYFNEDTKVPTIENGLWPYSLRDGDLLLIVMRRDGATVTMSTGWTSKAVGVFDVWWKYWHEGDARSVSITISGTPYDPGNPTAYDSDYWDGFLLLVRGVKQTADPVASPSATSGSGTGVTFGNAHASSAGDLLINTVFHASDTYVSGDYFTDLQNSVTDVEHFESFASGAVRASAPGNLGLLVGTVPKKGSAGATTAIAPASASWTTASFTLPILQPKEVVCGAAAGPTPYYGLTPSINEGDVVIRAGFDQNPSGDWTMLPGFPSTANGSYTYKVCWKRWKKGDTPDWSTASYPTETVPEIIVVRTPRKTGDPFSSVTVGGGYGTVSTSPSASGPKGALALVITQSAYLQMPYRYAQTSLDRYENQISTSVHSTIGSGYIGTSGTVPNFTTTRVSSHHWQSTVIVFKKT